MTDFNGCIDRAVESVVCLLNKPSDLGVSEHLNFTDMFSKEDCKSLFWDFFKEAFHFLGFEPLGICLKFESDPDPKQMCNSDYSTGLMVVNEIWLTRYVNNYKPTIIRSLAYYLAYGFVTYRSIGVTIPPYPQSFEANTFTVALFLLNGLPLHGKEERFLGEMALPCLKNFTGLDFKLEESLSVYGYRYNTLSFSDDINDKLYKSIKNCVKSARERKLDISKGTREHPFENVDEAVAFIKNLEKSEVEKDPFFNSFLYNFPYPYCYGIARIKGKDTLFGNFRISWASSKSAHYKNNFPPNGFIVTQLNRLSTPSGFIEWLYNGKRVNLASRPLFALKPNLSQRRFLFRGQTQEFLIKDTDIPTCKPGLYRESNKDVSKVASRIRAYEMMSVIAQNPLVKKLGVDGIKIFNEDFYFQLNLQGLAQHYYNSTDLMDLTSDIEVAKFFATIGYDSGSDSHFPYYSDKELGIIYIYDMLLPDAFVGQELPQLSTIGKQYAFHRSAMQSGFLLKMPENTNLHDLPNVYRIYFRHDKAISQKEFETSKKGQKYFPKDSLSEMWKDLRSTPNSEFKVSRKARELYFILHRNEVSSQREVDELLKKEGFVLGANDWPVLPPDFFEYYSKHANEIWKEFTKDIYFYGSEGAFMKKALMDLNISFK